MNILFYCPFKFSIDSKNIASLGGIESLNIDLCKELAKNKLKIFLATYTTQKIKKNGVTNIPIKEIIGEKNKVNFDVIVSSNEPNIFNYYQNSKKILWLHNTLSIEKAFRKKKLISILKNKITVVFVSEYLKNKTSNFYLFNKKIIIKNFLSKRFISKKIKFKRKPIFVWSVQRKKGLQEMINIWINKIYPLNKKIRFYVFGINKSDFEKKFQHYRKKNIFFFGRVSKNKLKHFYDQSSGMICLGFDETFCLNALEANSCGLPILTFGKTALKDLSINNYNSFLLRNYDEISKKILSISRNGLEKRMIKNSVNHSKKYRVEKIIRKWVQILKK